MAVALSGCTSMSSYDKPEINPAARYGQQVGSSAKSVTASTQWWLAFNDSTLNKLISQGLAQNITVQQAVEAVTTARETAAASGISGLPTVDTSASSTKSGNSTSDDIDTTNEGSATLSWEVDLFGKLAGKRQAARASIEAATEAANAAKLELIAEIATDYIEARGYQTRLRAAKSTLKSENETLAVTRQQNEVGVASKMDLAQIEGEAASTAADIPSLEISLNESIHALSVLLGQEPKSLQSLFAKSAPVPTVNRKVSAGIPADLMRDRPDIRQAERELAEATADIGVAEADLYPALTLGGTLSVSASTSWTLGPSLSLPIFNRGELKANVRLEESNARTAYLSYRETVLEAVEEVENALVGYSKQRERYTKLVQSYQSYNKAATLAEDSYEAGEIDLLDVLTAQRSFYSARDTLAQNTVSLASEYIELCKALGGGWDLPN